MTPLRNWLMAAGVAALVGCPAAAQADERKWEIDIHGGGLFAGDISDGLKALPPPGLSILTAVFRDPSRLASSWYFGDGARLLNTAIGVFRPTVAITPLDPVLQRPLATPRATGTVGVRVNRTMTRRLAIEVAAELGTSALSLDSNTMAAIRATSASFTTTWLGVERREPDRQLDRNVRRHAVRQPGASTSHDRRARRQPRDHEKGDALRHGGAGLAATIGDAPSGMLVGRYQALFGAARFVEADTVTIRNALGNTVVALVGGGLKYFPSSRWGVRADVRDHGRRADGG